MASAPGLPHTTATWQAALTRTEAVPEGKGKGIEQRASASKIEFEQFLRLRVLWRVQGISKLRDYQHGVPVTALEQAMSQLKGLDPWQEYLLCVEKHQLSGPLSQRLGVFALVLKHQREVKRVVLDANESTVYQEGSRYELRKRQEVSYQPEPEGTPVRSSTTRKFLGTKENNPPSTPITQLTQSLQDFSFTPQTPLAKARALDIEMFPKNPDEQIVNTALIDFLEAITIHLPCPAHWSLHRKAFRIQGFEARVDGYLAQGGTGHIKAIIEVKAALRNRQGDLSRVRMQEGAQMAAWIFTDKEEEGCFIIDQQAGRRRRILISQDRHQIFLTFADYGVGYTNHVRPPELEANVEDKKISKPANFFGKLGKVDSKKSSGAGVAAAGAGSDSDDFLTMNEFGPFETHNQQHMGYLGMFVLALVSKMCG